MNMAAQEQYEKAATAVAEAIAQLPFDCKEVDDLRYTYRRLNELAHYEPANELELVIARDQGNKARAIKRYRQRTGSSLKAAKYAVEEAVERYPTPDFDQDMLAN